MWKIVELFGFCPHIKHMYCSNNSIQNAINLTKRNKLYIEPFQSFCEWRAALRTHFVTNTKN